MEPIFPSLLRELGREIPRRQDLEEVSGGAVLQIITGDDTESDSAEGKAPQPRYSS